MIETPETWSADWAWGLPLTVLTVLTHAFGLVQIRERVVDPIMRRMGARRSGVAFAVLVAASVLLLAVLHGAEASAWAAAYVGLGALKDAHGAMLVSLNAMTTYGHDDIAIEPHWRLMAALEALNGVILFGLTTAFLFAVLHNNWPTHARDDVAPGVRTPPKTRAR